MLSYSVLLGDLIIVLGYQTSLPSLNDCVQSQGRDNYQKKKETFSPMADARYIKAAIEVTMFTYARINSTPLHEPARSEHC